MYRSAKLRSRCRADRLLPRPRAGLVNRSTEPVCWWRHHRSTRRRSSSPLRLPSCLRHPSRRMRAPRRSSGPLHPSKRRGSQSIEQGGNNGSGSPRSVSTSRACMQGSLMSIDGRRKCRVCQVRVPTPRQFWQGFADEFVPRWRSWTRTRRGSRCTSPACRWYRLVVVKEFEVRWHAKCFALRRGPPSSSCICLILPHRIRCDRALCLFRVERHELGA
jgi:hypothetical protein